VVKKLKSGKPSKERENYMMELAVERITEQPSDHWTSAAMLWGTEQEQASRMAYEAADRRPRGSVRLHQASDDQVGRRIAGRPDRR
jgi:hypothetical protein